MSLAIVRLAYLGKGQQQHNAIDYLVGFAVMGVTHNPCDRLYRGKLVSPATLM